MYQVIENLIIYQKALQLAGHIFPLVEKWTYFHQNTIGTQLVRSANSIAANISEGYGRFHFKERKSFYYYARGSLFETKTHLRIARMNNLISEDRFNELLIMADELLKILNSYIKATGEKT